MAPEDRTWVSIQHMRAMAALSVVMFHASQWARINFDIGAAGVDVFFVISGFVMWTVTADRKTAPLDFVRRRAIRVAPLYWLVTLALAAAALALPGRFPGVTPEPLHILLSLGFIQHLDPQGQPFPLLAPGWSLNYEAVFYLVFAACLMLPERHRLIALTMALATLSLAGFVWPPGYVMMLNPMFLQFLAGAWLGKLAQEGMLPDRTFGWIMLGVGQTLFIGLWLSAIDPDLWRPMIWGVPALLVVAGVVTVEADGGWPRWRWLGALGDASYSLYLTHTIAIAVLAIWLSAWNEWVFVPVAVALAITVGLLTHYAVEKPLLMTLRQRLA